MHPGPPSRSAGAQAEALSLDTVLPYAIRSGILGTCEVVDGSVRVTDHTRRNRNFKLVRADGPGFLVKQVGQPGVASMPAFLEREARVLEEIANHPALSELRWFTPRFVRFDAAQCILVTELVHPATSLTKFHLNVGDIRFPEESAATSARILADVRCRGRDALAGGALAGLAPVEPFVWSAFEPVHAAPWEFAPPIVALARLVREHARFWGKLPALRARWAAGRDLVHGDPRWDNLVLTSGDAPRVGEMNLRLIDWETAGAGESAWDVASFLAEYLRFWFAAAAIQNPRDLRELEERAAFPLAACHASARRFWAVYCEAVALDAGGARAFLAQVMEHVPFALVQIAYEQLRGQQALRGQGLAPFDLALRAAERPRDCAAAWWGLGGD